MSENEKHFCQCFMEAPHTPENQSAAGRTKAAVLKDYKWDNGAAIRIRFLEGDPGLQARVRATAEHWLNYANLKFYFVDAEPADVRIAFRQGNGSWSYIGTICRSIADPEPTMNYGWLTPQSSDAEIQRVVLHEFGHMIGLIHEHQNPQRSIRWNRAAVIHDLSGPPNNWNEQTIENNMFRFYAPDQVISTPVDATSIMMYPIPAAWTTDGFSAGFNSALSQEDKDLIGSVYPL